MRHPLPWVNFSDLADGHHGGLGFQKPTPPAARLLPRQKTLTTRSRGTSPEGAEPVARTRQSAQLREQRTKTYRETYLLAIIFRKYL
jgi:hypothetical protein